MSFSCEHAKPRLAEILGVETGEKFFIDVDGDGDLYGDFYVDDEGVLRWSDGDLLGNEAVYTAINHPERIVRKPCFTEPEMAVCKAVGARYVTRNDSACNSGFVTLWDRKPKLWEGTIYGVDGPVGSLASVEDRSGLFRSVKPGECIEVKEG